MSRRRRILIIAFLVVYLLSFLLNSIMYIDFRRVSAEEPNQNINIVAVFVDKSLYTQIKNDVQWYTKDYIQNKISDTKALVFPIDKSTFQAKDIYKMLENLYLEGQKDKSSRLIGTILIGDLPLPVVKNENYIFPTVYPYADFVNKKYKYDNTTKYFESTDAETDGVEIWHSLINFGNDKANYDKFFEKLKTYNSNPADYVETKIWYDDFANLKGSFSAINQFYYIINFMYLEDIAYHRYNPLMLSMINSSYYEQLKSNIFEFSSTLEELEKEAKTQYENADPEFEGFKTISEEYFSKAKQFKNSYMNTGSIEKISTSLDKIPTLLISKTLEGFLKNYSDLYGNEFLSTMRNNIATAGRRNIDDIDSHYKLTYIKDEISKKVIVDYNMLLEEAVNDAVEKNKYFMKIPVLHSYEIYKSGSCGGEQGGGSIYLDARYENNYFGKYAVDITGAMDFSIFRGTFLNNVSLSSIKGKQNKSSDLEDITTDINTKSVGASYSIFQRQIEANRGYNYLNSKTEADNYLGSRCSNSESVDTWAQRYRGGASPLNVEYNKSEYSFDLKNYNYKNSWHPSHTTTVGGSIYDNAGSRLLSSEEKEGYSYKGYNKYASLIKTQEGSPCGGKTNVTYCGSSSKTTLPYTNFEFNNLLADDNAYKQIVVNNSKTQEIYSTCSKTISTIGTGLNLVTTTNYSVSGNGSHMCNSVAECDKYGHSSGTFPSTTKEEPTGTIGIIGGVDCPENMYENMKFYDIGTKDTRVYHNSPTSGQINSMNMITADRPIDDPRYISFLGLGGDEVKLLYPDIFNIEVYTKSNGRLYLKSYEEIKSAVNDYLVKKVKKYNELLKSQYEKRLNYYQTQSGAFDFLGQSDELATPNRAYEYLSEDYFTNLLGEENINRIASSLYYVNYMWQERTYSDEITKDLKYIASQADLNKKIKYNTQSYLSSNSTKDKFINPGLVEKGYEVGYINSDGIDTVYSGGNANVPSIISKIQSSKISNSSIMNKLDPSNEISLESEKDDQECGVSEDGSVDLFQWPGALACWMSKMLTKPLSSSISNTFVSGGSGGGGSEQENELDNSYNNSINGGGTTSISMSQTNTTSVGTRPIVPNVKQETVYYQSQSQNNNQRIYKTLSETEKTSFDEIKSNILLSVQDTPVISLENLNDSTYKKYLSINSRKELGNLDFEIKLNGDNCFELNGTSICKKALQMSFNPYSNPQLLPIQVTEKKSGTSTFEIRICKQSSNVCYNADLGISFVSGKVIFLEIFSATDKVIKGGKVPFKIVGYDSYGNIVNQTFSNFKMSVDKGNIGYGSELYKEYEFSNFSQAYFVYDTSNLESLNSGEKDTLKVWTDESFSGYDANMLKVQKEFTLVEPKIEVKNGSDIVSSIQYQLPDSYGYLYPKNTDGFASLDESKIIKLDMTIKDSDGNGLSTPVTIYSKNSTLTPGLVKTKTFSTIQNGSNKSYSKQVFESKDEYIITDGTLSFYLHPNFDAGEDSLIIDVPGMDSYTIPIKIKAASAKQLDLSFEKTEFNIGEKTTGTVYLQDIWGNTVDYVNKTIDIGIIGNANISGLQETQVNLNNGVGTFDLSMTDPGGKIYVYAQIDGESLDDYAGDYETVYVKNISWPKDKINVMYLNLFGNDWGNLWGYFSDNKNIAKQVFNNSDKTLALTTQLISPDKIKSLSYEISSDLRIFNFNDESLVLNFTGKNMIIEMGNDLQKSAKLNIGSLSDFAIKKVDSFPLILSSNTINYLPGQIDSTITSNVFKDNKVIVNDLTIIDFSNGTKLDNVEIFYNGINDNGFGIWSIDYEGILIGELLIYRDDSSIVDNSGSNTTLFENYKSIVLFGEGTTNGKKGIGIYKNDTSSKGIQTSFKSIENSIDQDDSIGFRAGFGNIVDFGNGLNVGESTKNFESEFVVNFGDALLTRVDKNELNEQTTFDYGMGKKIYSSSSKDILKVVEADLNNDGLNDIVVAYADGTIKQLKNYGGTNPYIDLGELISIADGIDDVFVGDVDKNGFQDLIVKTRSGNVRVYTNKNGIFDIDGKLVCLDVSGGPDKVNGVYQIFFEDMNLDGGVDIVTNDDKGDIKIFYGGMSGSGYNYLSNLSYKCDDERLTREKPNIKYIKGYGVRVTSGTKIYDESLVHWQGIVNNSNDPVSSLSGYAKTMTGNNESAGIESYQQIINKVYPIKAKYQSLSQEYKPTYEEEADSYDYAHMVFLTGTDAVLLSKSFEDMNGGILEKGDKVKINVNIEGKKDTKMTYLDLLQGPRAVLVDDDTGVISGFDYGTLQTGYSFNWNPGDGFIFMLDNLSITNGTKQEFSYIVNYYGAKIIKIGLEDINEDKYPDIKVMPTDGCIKCSYNFESKENGTQYQEKKNDYTQEYNAMLSTLSTPTQNYYNNIKQNIQNVTNNGNFSGLENYGLYEERVQSNYFNLVSENNTIEKNAYNDDNKKTDLKNNFIDFLSSFGDKVFANVPENQISLGVSGAGAKGSKNKIEINDNALMGTVEKLKEGINNVLHGLCKGFYFGKENKCGIPIPFNVAFFAPGTYNIMGCPIAYDMGTPVFFYPGTIYAPYPIPFPNALKSFADGFYWAPGGIYPSMIRIYLAPTLTMGLGVVVCFGQYFASGFSIPAPFGTITGNCVVAGTNVSLQCNTPTKKGNSKPNSINPFMKNSYQVGSCSSKIYGSGKTSSPLTSVSINSSGEISNNSIANSESFLGSAFNLSGNAKKISSKLLKAKKQSLQGGDPINLKIEGGTVKGLIQCIIKKWLDKQIRYIINNLTNMTVYVYLPDLESLSEGFDKLNFDHLDQIRDDFKSDFNDIRSGWNSGSGGGGGNGFERFANEWLPSKNAFKKTGDTLSNPFEQIEKLLENVPFFKVNTKKVNVQIPMIYQEDVVKYSKYLQSWIDRQEGIIEEWQDVEGGLDFKVNANGLISSVRKNIQTLQEYSQFPFKLYDWLHGIDKYLKEIMNTVKMFMKSTIGWLKENAERFENWVDLIILLIGIMETWQILIDWSVDWRTGCAKCRQDDYDQYTCILSLLCIELPVLPIPPFKIPDIYLDFSNINLGIDIVLPKFGFSPMAISLPYLPDLPRPPSGAMGFSLPSIPLLPQLPSLPTLPTISISFNLELPTLPPAPKIPEIMPAIRVILNILKFIGWIYCIIKQGIGLVEEWNSKARVEQLTNRTRRVFPFDFLDITFIDPPLGGSDIRLDAYLNLKFNFDMLYQIASSLTSTINSSTGKIIESVSSTSTNLSEPIKGPASMLNNAVKQGQGLLNQGKNILNNVTNGVQNNINPDPTNSSQNKNKYKNSLQNLNQEINIEIENPIENQQNELENNIKKLNYNNGVKNVYGSGMDYKQAYIKLKSELMFMKEKDTDKTRNETTEKIITMIDMDKGIAPNYDGIEKVSNDFINYLEEKRQGYDALAKRIRDDYDMFLNDVAKDRLVSQDDESLEFTTSLFLSNPKVKDILKSQEHPTKTYLDMNAQILKGFKNSINTHTPSSLNMTDDVYAKSKDYINKLAYEVDEARSSMQDKVSYIQKRNNEVTKPSLVASNTSTNNVSNTSNSILNASTTNGSVSTGTEMSGSLYGNSNQISVDPTQFVKGFFVKGIDGDYYNVFNRQEKGEETYLNNKYKMTDVNKDGNQDILWRDSKSVYIKYYNQNDNFMLSHNKIFTEYYNTKEFSSISDLQEEVDENGYIQINGNLFKVWDSKSMVNNYKRSGSNYENFSFSWNTNQNENITGYVIKLIQRQDVYYDKKKQMEMYGTDVLDEKFILIVGEKFDQASNKIIVDKSLNGGFVYDYVKSGKIIKVINADITQESLSAVLSNIPRKWYYTKIAGLVSSNTVLTKKGPWSNQKLAGSQLRGDSQVPTLSTNLVRDKTGKVVSQGYSLNGYINTNYTLNANWQDNGYIVESYVEKDGEIIQTSDKNSTTINNLYFTGVGTYEYTFSAIDHAGNLNDQKVQININVPSISIDKVQTSNLGGKIIAKLSNDIDDGVVKFERYRDSNWSVLTGITNSNNTTNYTVTYNQNYVTGGVFDLSDEISFYDANKNEIGTIKVDNAKLEIHDNYKNNYEVKVDFSSKTALIKVIDKLAGIDVFAIFLKASKSLNQQPLKVLNGNYELVNITSGMMGEFQGGSCLRQKEGECVIYVSTKGLIYVPTPYNTEFYGVYEYQQDTDSIRYTIYDLQDNQIAQLDFVAQALR